MKTYYTLRSVKGREDVFVKTHIPIPPLTYEQWKVYLTKTIKEYDKRICIRHTTTRTRQ